MNEKIEFLESCFILNEGVLNKELGNLYDLVTMRMAKDKAFAYMKDKQDAIKKIDMIKAELIGLISKFPNYEVKCNILFNFSLSSLALGAVTFGLGTLFTGFTSGDWGLFKSYMVVCMEDLLINDRQLFLTSYIEGKDINFIDKISRTFRNFKNGFPNIFIGKYIHNTNDIILTYTKMANNAKAMLLIGDVSIEKIMLTCYCYVALIEDLQRFNRDRIDLY